jgi:hypothetical protein
MGHSYLLSSFVRRGSWLLGAMLALAAPALAQPISLAQVEHY